MDIDFESVVRENTGRIFRIAYHMLGDRQEAEDAVQDIFYEAFKSLPGYSGRAPVENWLYRIAMNVLADGINRKSRRRKSEDGLEMEARERAGELPAGGGSAEADFMKNENLREIRRAVLRLPARYRAVFILNVVEGYNHNEIAKILGISPGSARVIRVRAAKKIRQMLDS